MEGERRRRSKADAQHNERCIEVHFTHAVPSHYTKGVVSLKLSDPF